MFFTDDLPQLFDACHPFLPIIASLDNFYIFLQLDFIFSIHFVVVVVIVNLAVDISVAGLLGFRVQELSP